MQKVILVLIALLSQIQFLAGRPNVKVPSFQPIVPSMTPQILSVEPVAGPVGTVVTIHGQGFSSADNIVYTSYDRRRRPSADGETISFAVVPSFAVPINFRSIKRPEFTGIDFKFYVRNASGLLTTTPGNFKLTF